MKLRLVRKRIDSLCMHSLFFILNDKQVVPCYDDFVYVCMEYFRRHRNGSQVKESTLLLNAYYRSTINLPTFKIKDVS